MSDVEEFSKRLFTGRDLLMFMDEVGVGVGATMHVVQQCEMRHELRPEIYKPVEGNDLPQA